MSQNKLGAILCGSFIAFLVLFLAFGEIFFPRYGTCIEFGPTKFRQVFIDRHDSLGPHAELVPLTHEEDFDSQSCLKQEIIPSRWSKWHGAK